jgi:hypothetical protein
MGGGWLLWCSKKDSPYLPNPLDLLGLVHFSTDFSSDFFA